MKHLYKGNDNAMNYIFIRDMERGDDDTAIVNWDLSDEEIDEIIKAFGADENDESWYACEPEFDTFENVTASMNSFEHIA